MRLPRWLPPSRSCPRSRGLVPACDHSLVGHYQLYLTAGSALSACVDLLNASFFSKGAVPPKRARWQGVSWIELVLAEWRGRVRCLARSSQPTSHPKTEQAAGSHRITRQGCLVRLSQIRHHRLARDASSRSASVFLLRCSKICRRF